MKHPRADLAVTHMWTHEIRGVARDGDWLLTRSYFLAADAITLATGGSGVREIPLEQLVERNHYIIVVRPSGMTAAEESLAVARARLKVGTEFDGAGMFGLDPDTFYCSELVWWASEVQGRTADEPIVITPSDLMKYGSVIYYSGKRPDPDRSHERVDRSRHGVRPAHAGRDPLAATSRAGSSISVSARWRTHDLWTGTRDARRLATRRGRREQRTTNRGEEGDEERT